jgi:hypothetical protein
MTGIAELYGVPTAVEERDWADIVQQQACPYLNRRCLKFRKSAPNITIGTCSVYQRTRKISEPLIICPHRLLQRRRIFSDCRHLLTGEEPGNDLHIVSEVNIPGGNVDYFLVSTRDGKVKDFVGIEIQTLDTTGSLWLTRQQFLSDKGMPVNLGGEGESSSYGINWKMTAKTILMQLHHKVQTFEAIHKHLVLAVQEPFLAYMQRNFVLDHFHKTPLIDDAMHIHAYKLSEQPDKTFRLMLSSRFSTDANGIKESLGSATNPNLTLQTITDILQAKISDETTFVLVEG